MSAGGGPAPKLPLEVRLCDATDVCAKCGAMAVTSKCSRCLRVCYCNKQCQEKHWSVHKKICKTPAQQEAGAGQQEDRNRRLYSASFLGDLPTVRALIAEGADVNWAKPETRHTHAEGTDFVKCGLCSEPGLSQGSNTNCVHSHSRKHLHHY